MGGRVIVCSIKRFKSRRRFKTYFGGPVSQLTRRSLYVNIFRGKGDPWPIYNAYLINPVQVNQWKLLGASLNPYQTTPHIAVTLIMLDINIDWYMHI